MAARQGTLHQYTRRLVAFEHAAPHGASSADASSCTVIFVAGLGDGLRTTAYAGILANRLPSGWTLAEIVLGSSYNGWGTSSIAQDADEIGQCVEYFRKLRPEGKIVLMGHSTGCQDIMEYLAPRNPETAAGKRRHVHGAIFQAPASDREGWRMHLSDEVYENGVKTAREISARDADELVPRQMALDTVGGIPCTARRWLSLASPDHDGEDDLFSSDLTDEQLGRSFGSLPRETPVCILYSGDDEHVPDHIDKEALVQKWLSIAEKGGATISQNTSGIVPGASHNLGGNHDDVRDEALLRVVRFLGELK